MAYIDSAPPNEPPFAEETEFKKVLDSIVFLATNLPGLFFAGQVILLIGFALGSRDVLGYLENVEKAYNTALLLWVQVSFGICSLYAVIVAMKYGREKFWAEVGVGLVAPFFGIIGVFWPYALAHRMVPVIQAWI